VDDPAAPDLSFDTILRPAMTGQGKNIGGTVLNHAIMVLFPDTAWCEVKRLQLWKDFKIA
jgi:hypothetical protein